MGQHVRQPLGMTGLMKIEAEMARQHRDALASFEAAEALACKIAASIRHTGRLALLGMGGSHWVNRTASFLYRELGVEVEAAVLSEVLLCPLPDRARTVILTSQSGNSGEIARYLETSARQEDRFGITLNQDGTLARLVPALIGAGGMETAFAATRSILVTQALHLAVLGALGADTRAALAVLAAPPQPSTLAAQAALAPCDVLILSGRLELQGVAESGALCLMELARMPALALEGGQLRHGPMEMLTERTGIVLLRPAGAAGDLAPGLAAACRAAGCPVVIFDLSGRPAIPETLTVPFARQTGMAAAFSVLPALQALLVALAGLRVADVGTPVRSTKVTTEL